jgi:hypothetical protein
MQNPYPIHPGFGFRVMNAAKALRKYGENPNYRLFTRSFDNCFENYDGDAVIFALMAKAIKEKTAGQPALHEGIKRAYGGVVPWELETIARGCAQNQLGLFEQSGT